MLLINPLSKTGGNRYEIHLLRIYIIEEEK